MWDIATEQEGERVSAFKWRHFEGVIIVWAVRWYYRYGIRYRDLEQMMGERGRESWPLHDLPLGPEIRARSGEAATLAVALSAVDQLASR